MRTALLRLAQVLTTALILAVVGATLLAYVSLNSYLAVLTFGTLGIVGGCIWAAFGLLEGSRLPFRMAGAFLLVPLSAFAVWVAAVNFGIAWLSLFTGKG